MTYYPTRKVREFLCSQLLYRKIITLLDSNTSRFLWLALGEGYSSFYALGKRNSILYDLPLGKKEDQEKGWKETV
jgi:hypothetical protein